jgi:hypothetical protein
VGADQERRRDQAAVSWCVSRSALL